MMNIVCKNTWKSVGCCNGTTDVFVRGIQIVKGEKIVHEFLYPFEVYLTSGAIHFTKNGKETVVAFSDLAESKSEIKSIIKNCASGIVMERRTTGALVVDTNELSEVDLTPYMQSGDVIAGIYDVYAPQYVNEGLLPEDYTVLSNGNIQLNTPVPVEPEPYVITVNFWVYV